MSFLAKIRRKKDLKAFATRWNPIDMVRSRLKGQGVMALPRRNADAVKAFKSRNIKVFKNDEDVKSF